MKSSFLRYQNLLPWPIWPGVVVFLIFVWALGFWVPHGVLLYQGENILGQYAGSSNIYFPYIGLTIFGIFLVQYCLGKTKYLHPTRKIYALCLVVFLTLNAIFSLQPEIGVLGVGIWCIGLLCLSLSLERFLYNNMWWGVYSLGLVLGTVFAFENVLLFETLAVALLFWQWWGGRITKNLYLKGIYLFLPLIWSLIWGNFYFYILIGIVGVGLSLRFVTRNRYTQIWPMAYLLGFLSVGFWAWKSGMFFWPDISWFEGPLLEGVGIGQSFLAQYNTFENIANPKLISLPELGITRIWYEQGIFGIISLYFLWALGFNKNTKVDWIKHFIFWGSTLVLPMSFILPSSIWILCFWYLAQDTAHQEIS